LLNIFAMTSAAPVCSPFSPLIARLYHEAQIALPTAERPVVPLRRLVAAQELNQRELPCLTSRGAIHFLLSRSAMVEAWPDTTSQPLSAFLYANASGGCIFVRQEDSVARRRFCATHQLAHYLLHFPIAQKAATTLGVEVEFIEALPPLSNPDADEISDGKIALHAPGAPAMEWPLAPQEMEHEADAFAAALLMPEDILRELVGRYCSHCSDFDLIWRLSTEMLVPRSAMKVRLRHLGLLRGESLN
jgi:hypothetical protein